MIAHVNGRAPREYAADYIGAGWSVIPIKNDGSKQPALKAWKHLQERAATQAEFRQYWLADNIGVGIIHGAVSGNTEALDIDNDDLWRPYVVEVERLAPGLLDKLTIIKTPRPGRHLLYKCSVIEHSQKLAQRYNPDDPSKPKTLIETKGEGGLTVAPGSPSCCHESGRLYEHVSGPPLTELPTITPEEREVLLLVARSFNELFDESPTTVSKAKGAIYNGLSPGDDFNQRAAWEEILEPHGWVNTHGKYWRRPGKENGWSATVGCPSQQGTELFCCFTSSAYPLQGANGRSVCTTYSRFALYAALNHGGDYSAAATRLRTEGYGDQPAPRTSDGGDRYSTSPGKAEPPKPRRIEPLERVPVERLMEDYPVLNEPVVDGWVRVMETMNIIAYPKFGKSWFGYYLAYCIVTGQPVFRRYPVKRGKVLIVDLELHRNLIASRLRTVARAMELVPGDYAGMIEVISLRGKWQSVDEIIAGLSDVKPGEFVLCIVDSKYRLNIDGGDENANGGETLLYNKIDQLAEWLGAAVALIHHLTKGNQTDRRVTDLGAGGGAQSRAADTHIALREHEDEGVAVLDGAVRSFPPLQPLAIRWEFPLWVADEWADPDQLKGTKSPSEEKQRKKDKKGRDDILAALLKGPLTKNEICTQTGMGKDRFDRLIGLLKEGGHIATSTTTVAHNPAVLYHLYDPDLEGGLEQQTTRPDHQTA